MKRQRKIDGRNNLNKWVVQLTGETAREEHPDSK